MRILRLRRDIQDLGRLREIVTILVRRGFHDLLAKARLSRHAAAGARLAPAAETTPQLLRETLEELGPTFVKLGQVLSLRPDLIPHRYCEEFRRLQDGVEPLGWPIIKGVIESELGVPLDRVFRSFSHEPLAAASIAQVHEATLKGGGTVAVKVQRPGIRERMERDIDIMEYLARRLDRHLDGLSATGIVEEFKAYTERELDFRFELRTLKKFRAFFDGNEEVVIPEPHEERSTGRLLIMEYLRGAPVSDKERLKREGHDLPGLARIGFQAMFDQVFRLGIFHADPHPGNLLAIKRPDGQALGVLDFGIVGFLDQEMRDRMLQVIDYMVKQDARGLVWATLKIGRATPRLDKRALEEEVSALLMDWHGTTFAEQRMSELLFRLLNTSIAHGVELPANAILVAKAFLTIEGCASWLDPDFNPTEAFGPALQGLAWRRVGRAKEESLRALRDVHEFAGRLPEAADAFLDRMAEGRFRFSLDEEEFRRWERHDEIETSRKSLALTAAALFIGSSLLAGLAPELAVATMPLWQLGLLLFLLTLLLLILATIATHKYVEGREGRR